MTIRKMETVSSIEQEAPGATLLALCCVVARSRVSIASRFVRAGAPLPGDAHTQNHHCCDHGYQIASPDVAPARYS